MEISVTCQLDEKALRAFNGVVMFGQKEPERMMHRNTLLACLIIPVCIGATLLAGETILIVLGLIASGVLLLLTILNHWAYFISPRQAHKQSLATNVENRFVFYDDKLHLTSTGTNGYIGEEYYPYTMLFKIVETYDYFFLFLDKAHAHVVSKKNLKNSEAEQIRNALKNAKEFSYIECNY